MKLGDEVIVDAGQYDPYTGLEGVITDVLHSSDLPYTVTFDNGDQMYFEASELEVIS